VSYSIKVMLHTCMHLSRIHLEVDLGTSQTDVTSYAGPIAHIVQ